MARTKEKQKRIGSSERKLVDLLYKKIKVYKIFKDAKKQHETAFNSRLLDHLRQDDRLMSLRNRNIPKTTIVGESFRPEFYLSNDKKNLCAVECKRLTDSHAKLKWKEGLSQALLYSLTYRAVILLFFDFTKNSKYCKAFGPGNKTESKFAAQLRREKKIYIVVLKPADV